MVAKRKAEKIRQVTPDKSNPDQPGEISGWVCLVLAKLFRFRLMFTLQRPTPSAQPPGLEPVLTHLVCLVTMMALSLTPPPPPHFLLKVVLEVRKSAEGDPGALYEELETVRRAVISEGCYPSRLVSSVFSLFSFFFVPYFVVWYNMIVMFEWVMLCCFFCCA